MANMSYREQMSDAQIRQEQNAMTNYLINDIGFSADDMGVALKQFTLEKFTEYVDTQLRAGKDNKSVIASFRREFRGDMQNTVLQMFGLKSAAAIEKSDAKPPQFLIDDILPIGLTVLNGAPKVGKSLLALQLAIAIANGTEFLGHQAHKSDVIYWDLESKDHREKSRLKRMLDGAQCPDNLHIAFDLQPNQKIADSVTNADGGLVGGIRTLIESMPSVKFFVIDTFSRARGNINTMGRNAYDVDVELLSPLQKLAVNEEIGIMLVHHLKKGADKVGDITEMSSGTQGIPGTSDTNWYYFNADKSRMDTHRLLQVRPRDAEEQDISLLFSKRTLTVDVDTTPAADVMGMPLAKYCIDNCPDKTVSEIIPYSQMYRAAYGCNTDPDNVGSYVMKTLAPVQQTLAEQYGVYVMFSQKSGNNRGVRIMPYQPAV